MMTLVEVVRGHGDLRRERWVFEVFDFPRMYLERYCDESRESKRHRKWKVSRAYFRLNPGRSWDGQYIREEPEVPGVVLGEALEQMRGHLEFKKWDRR